jgi:hypothetical protein
MENQISRGLRTTFLAQTVIHVLFGLVLLLIPDVYAKLTGLPVLDWAMSIARMLGASQLGFSVADWFAYKETAWERVKIVVQMEIVFNVLGTLAGVYALIFGGWPARFWMNVVITAAFAVAFTVFYYRA